MTQKAVIEISCSKISFIHTNTTQNKMYGIIALECYIMMYWNTSYSIDCFWLNSYWRRHFIEESNYLYLNSHIKQNSEQYVSLDSRGSIQRLSSADTPGDENNNNNNTFIVVRLHRDEKCIRRKNNKRSRAYSIIIL